MIPLRPAYIQTGPPGQPAAPLPVRRARGWGRECLKLSWTSVCPVLIPKIFSHAWAQAAVMKVIKRKGQRRTLHRATLTSLLKFLEGISCCVMWIIAEIRVTAEEYKFKRSVVNSELCSSAEWVHEVHRSVKERSKVSNREDRVWGAALKWHRT